MRALLTFLFLCLCLCLASAFAKRFTDIETLVRTTATADSLRHAHTDSLLAGVLEDASVWHSDKKGTEQAQALLKIEKKP